MSIHLRGIHSADHARADVRVARQLCADTTEQLRHELDRPLPWPLKQKFTHSTNEKDIT
jgi:hypothetical protein